MPKKINIWYEIGRALRGILKPGDQRERPRTGGVKPRRKAAQQTESPGQFGTGATRNASATELRNARIEYAPSSDGNPDPGEVVWTWVPYEENDGRGKDRPVLIIGRVDVTSVIGCYVSTKRHSGFIPIGRGAWDPQGRESFLAPERILIVSHEGMRREGAQVSAERFSVAVRGVLERHGLK